MPTRCVFKLLLSVECRVVCTVWNNLQVVLLRIKEPVTMGYSCEYKSLKNVNLRRSRYFQTWLTLQRSKLETIALSLSLHYVLYIYTFVIAWSIAKGTTLEGYVSYV